MANGLQWLDSLLVDALTELEWHLFQVGECIGYDDLGKEEIKIGVLTSNQVRCSARAIEILKKGAHRAFTYVASYLG